MQNKTSDMNQVPVNNWATYPAVSSMGASRSGAKTATIGSVIYVIGGYDGTSYPSTCEAYHTTVNKWVPISAMSKKRMGACVASVGHNVYGMGGYNGSFNMNSCEVFDTTTNTWSAIAGMLGNRRDAPWRSAGASTSWVDTMGKVV